MAMEIDEAVIRVDNHAEIDEVEPIEISDDEARRVRLYENFYQVNAIDPALYAQHDVKRGLRNADGTGVLAGMTNISNVHGYVMSDGEKMPAEGSLRLRGYDLYDLLGDLDPTRRFAFEEVAYLLLMGELPTQERLNRFVEVIDSQRELPDGFTASTLMVDTSPDLMNMMARSILRLYAADESAEDRSPEHEIHTALSLISRLPRIMVLAYYAKQAAFNHESMIMHRFVPGQSTAETILIHAAPRPLVHAGRGPHARHHAVPARRARRRQQLVLHDPRALLGGHRPLFHLCGGLRVAQGPSPWRCESPGARHAGGDQGKREELGRRRRSGLLPGENREQAGL